MRYSASKILMALRRARVLLSAPDHRKKGADIHSGYRAAIISWARRLVDAPRFRVFPPLRASSGPGKPNSTPADSGAI